MSKKSIFFLALISLALTLPSCDSGRDCPDGMEDCELQDGTVICAPKGSC
ncbi:hypothetical protein [Reichenbachiella sp.]